MPVGKRCTVAYATRARQYLWQLELAPAATVADALGAARAVAPAGEAIPWDTAVVGISGETCARSLVYAEGDRI